MGVNIKRGETEIEVEGRKYTLCLTLGALAEIETALEIDNLGELEARMAKSKISDILAILMALLKGGGSEVSEEEIRMWPMSKELLNEALVGSFKAAGLADEAGNPPKKMPPPVKRK